MPRPQGWHSQTPSLSHEHMARCRYSESGRTSDGIGGLTSMPIGALVQPTQSRRCRSRRTTGAGGLMAQFCAPGSPSAFPVRSTGRQAGARYSVLQHTLQTAVPQRRHSETLSRAHWPALPL